MLLNYLKLAFRFLLRNPFFTAINIIGLAIGFTSFYILWDHATTELKSDQFHKDSERIARVGINWNWTDDGGQTWGHLTFGFAYANLFPAVQEDYPEVTSTLRILPQIMCREVDVGHRNKIVITVEDHLEKKKFKEQHVVYADSNLFSFFSIPLIYGDQDEVLSQENYVVLSQSTSKKYFGEIDPRGSLIKLNDTTTLMVSGVYKNLPHYSHLNFDLAISNRGHLTIWESKNSAATTNYMKFKESDFADFQDKINQNIDKYLGYILKDFPQVKADFYVQPLVEIPFSTNYVGDQWFIPKSQSFLLILAFIAMSVLVMAWINYINLTIARTSKRFKEIATRKVSGARAGDFVGQFLTESIVFNMLALLVAFTVVQIVRIPTQEFFNFSVPALSDLSFESILIFGVVVLIGILLTGLYPAFISIAYQPKSLFRVFQGKSERRLIPSLLTISQMVAALVFLLLGFVMYHQLNFILNKDTGIKRDEAIVIEAPVVKPQSYSAKLSAFKKVIKNTISTAEVALSKFDVNVVNGGNVETQRLGSELFYGMDANSVDEDFIPFYELNLIAGRNFLPDDQPNGIVLSRFALERLGLGEPEESINARINIRVQGVEWKEAVVIGIIENFRNSPYLNVGQNNTEANDNGRGIVLVNANQKFGSYFDNLDAISIRFNQENFKDVLSKTQRLFEEQFPGAMFNWSFLDDKLNAVYTNEKIARNQVVLFTCLAVIIACLGMLSMITNLVLEKTKEVGIRKVLGAELHQIVYTLLGATAKQLLIATLLGVPASFYLMQEYFEKYSERIELQWWHFAFPVAILITIMLSSVATVVWKAAKSNPVDALKYE